MILGIDVGGTRTDAVCIAGREIVASAKVLTGSDLVESIIGVISALAIDCRQLSRVVLSTTLSTNAIVESKYPRTGMIVSAGPGIDPHHFFLSDDFYLVSGAMDHRGREFETCRPAEVAAVVAELKQKSVTGVGVVSKFCTRNHAHESQIHELIKSDFDYISLGHLMSGSRNFPRRINTAYYNTAVMPLQERFVGSVKKALMELGINANLRFLKADGGTYMDAAAERLPVETIMSGPAASMMGTLARANSRETVLVLDVGGTTTDIGALVDGAPLLEKGISVGGRKTLVRGLNTRSVGIGGDSVVAVVDGELKIGPRREGPPVCLGGKLPTPMDALRVLGDFGEGDAAAAYQALAGLAAPLKREVDELAREIVRLTASSIHAAARRYIDELNAQPVYTIHELLHAEPVRPAKVILVGGPASYLQKYVAAAFVEPVEVPERPEVTNALGAALARTTGQITLLADTQLGRLTCPELDLVMPVDRYCTLEDLKKMGIEALNRNIAVLGLSPNAQFDVVEEHSFNMVRGFSSTGKLLRVKIQTRPGIIREWSQSC